MWLGKDPSRVQADPCPRIRARVSCSRLSPQRLGVLQRPLPLTPRPRDERSKPLFPPPPPAPAHRNASPHRIAGDGGGTPPATPSPPLQKGALPRSGSSPPPHRRRGVPPPRKDLLLAGYPRETHPPSPPPHPRALPPYRRARAGRYLSGGASRACGRRGLSWPHTPPAANPRPLSNPARVCPAAAASEGAPCEEGAQLRDPGL